VGARQTRLVFDGCTCPLVDEEEAMSTAEPLGEDQWPAIGVDLETRRRRILATLTALGRPREVEQFQRALAAATRTAAETQDYAGLEGVVQGWYLHALALRTVPGWVDRWEALRREPPALVSGDARSLEDVFADLDLPRPE
jgi:hypothetical protein